MPSVHAGGALQQRGIQGFDGGVRRKLDGGAKGWDDLSLAGDNELQWPQGTLAPAGAHYSPGLPQELRMLVPASAAPERAPLSASALDGRPASPSTVEKMASMLRSLSFSAGRPLVGGDAAARGAQFLHVASTLQGELGAAHMQRLRERSPALARRLEGVLIASMATLLGAHAVEGAKAHEARSTAASHRLKRRAAISRRVLIVTRLVGLVGGRACGTLGRGVGAVRGALRLIDEAFELSKRRVVKEQRAWQLGPAIGDAIRQARLELHHAERVEARLH